MPGSHRDASFLRRSLSSEVSGLAVARLAQVFLKRAYQRVWLATALLAMSGMSAVADFCPTCTDYQSGVVWGTTAIDALREASGMATSARNPGVLWIHNDGSRKRVFAVATNASTLATFEFELDLDDVEGMAVGPGPAAGISYLYFGDIGGNASPDDIRAEVRIMRVPEPVVDLAWADSPRTEDFTGIQSFILRYPDGSYDAETLIVDPRNGDLYVGTKENGSCRFYKANLNTAADGSTLDLVFAGTVGFGKASGGDISADGRRIALRREDAATLWARCDDESIESALGRSGYSIPVIGPPTEDNGEAIAFLRQGMGYVTISEGRDQPIHYFASPCPVPPLVRIMNHGTTVRIAFDAEAGRQYLLEARKDMTAGVWSPTTHTLQPASSGPHYFEVERSIDGTFYRVVVP